MSGEVRDVVGDVPPREDAAVHGWMQADNAVPEHLGEARGVGGELPVPVNVLVGVHHLDRDGAFVWIHPDNDVFVHARSLESRQ